MAPLQPQHGSPSLGPRGAVLLIGFPKAGSTALFSLLAQHPGLTASVEKENLTLYPAIWEGRPARRRELEAYVASLPRLPGQWPLEGTPGTVFLDTATIGWLARLLPAGRIVAVIRPPRERLYSAYRFQRRRGLRTRTFGAFVLENIRGYEAGIRMSPGMTSGFHVTCGLYGRSLAPWVERFPDRVAVVDAASLEPDRARTTLDAVATWLGLAPFQGLVTKRWNQAPPARRARFGPGDTDRLPTSLEERLAEIHEQDRLGLQRLLKDPGGGVMSVGCSWV